MHPPPPPPFCLRLSRRGIDGREGSAATAVVRVTKRGSHQLNVRQCFLSAELICQGDGQDLVFVLLTNQQMFNLKMCWALINNAEARPGPNSLPACWKECGKNGKRSCIDPPPCFWFLLLPSVTSTITHLSFPVHSLLSFSLFCNSFLPLLTYVLIWLLWSS